MQNSSPFYKLGRCYGEVILGGKISGDDFGGLAIKSTVHVRAIAIVSSGKHRLEVEVEGDKSDSYMTLSSDEAETLSDVLAGIADARIPLEPTPEQAAIMLLGEITRASEVNGVSNEFLVSFIQRARNVTVEAQK